MLQVMVSLAVAIWFYHSARAVHKPGIAWAIVGALVAFLPGFATGVVLGVVASYGRGSRTFLHQTSAIALVGAGVIAGVLLSVWVQRVNMRKVAASAATGDSAAQLGTVDNLALGNLGLPMTFWGFGLGSNFALLSAFALLFAFLRSFSIRPDDLAVPFYAIYLSCQVLLSLAIWHAADKYSGRRLWAIGAKSISCVYTVSWAVFAIAAIFKP